MINRLLTFPRLEFARFWKRPLNVIMFVLLSLMTVGLVAGGVQIRAGSADTGGPKLAINGAFNLAFADAVLCSLILPFFVAVACGMPVLTDFDRKINRLISATPISHVEYAFSRFLAAIGALTVVLAAWLLVQICIYQFWPIDINERVRVGFELANYLTPLLLFGLPLLVFVGGVSMWLGVRTRQPVLVFALPVIIVVGGLFFLWDFNPEWLPRWVDRLMQAVDPTGFRWFSRTFVQEDRGVLFYNSSRISPDTLLITSRIGVAAIGLFAVCATGWRLERTEHADLRVRNAQKLLDESANAAPVVGDQEHAVISARRGNPEAIVRAPGFIGSTLHVLRQETRALLRSPGVWLFGPLILLQTWAITTLRLGPLDTSLLLTTGFGAGAVFNTLSLLLCFLTLFYTVESLVREERCGLNSIFRAAPVPTGAVLAGKVLANALLALLIIGCASTAIAITLALQTMNTGISIPFELPVLVLILGALLAPTIVVWSAYITLLYAVLRNRFVVYGVALGTLLATGFATRFGWMNWFTSWNMYGGIQWSELDRLSFMWNAIVVNRLFVLALAAFFIVVTLALWPRRQPDLRAMADRLRPLPLLRGMVLPAIAALPMVGLGAHAGLSVRQGFQGQPQIDAEKAYWKRNSKTWENASLPALDVVNAEVKLFPEIRSLEVVGTYVLRNPNKETMAEIPLTVGLHFQTSDWTVNSVATDPSKRDQPLPCIENRNNLFVIKPVQPLAKNETVEVHFKLTGEFPKGWTKQGGSSTEFILPSGVVLTSFSGSFLPVVGFSDGVGIDDKNRRDAREYPLDHWKSRVDPGFGPAWSTKVKLAVEGPAYWVINGVGVEKENSEANGRRRIVWEADHPVRFFNIVGGPLQASEGEVSTVYSNKRTPHNVPTMVKALDAARKNYAMWFGKYPWKNLRVTQFPALASYAQGFPGNISFAENIGFLSEPIKDSKETGALDAAFYIVAHESGHQWWGNIVTPGKGPGGNIISEGLAEFSALMLVHHELGEEQGQTLRRRWEQKYVNGRSADNERPMTRVDGSRPGDGVVTYPRSGFVFWMLRGLMGEDAMLAGLKDFVVRWCEGVETEDGLDFPLIEDLIESLRPHAPDPEKFDSFVSQWVKGKALPELEVTDTLVSQDQTGYIVTGKLTNLGTGEATVRLRFLDGESTKNGKKPEFQEVTVSVKAGETISFQAQTRFKPVNLVCDPDVELLFAGRKRTETTLKAP